MLAERRKGMELPIRTVAAILLGILVVVVVFAGASGWLEQLATEFLDAVSFPDPMP